MSLHSILQYYKFIIILDDFSISSGANIGAADNNSYTPLMTAAANGQVGAFNALRAKGAELDRLDRDGKSIVFLAAEANHVPILKVSASSYCKTATLWFSLLCICWDCWKCPD